MSERKEENNTISYPTLEKKIKMKVEKEKIQYAEFKNYLQKDKVLPNGLTVEKQKMEDIRNRSWKKVQHKKKYILQV